MADVIRHGQVVDGKWITARKTQVCVAEPIVEETKEVVTSWGATLTGKRGDYVVSPEANLSDRWVVQADIFRMTYEEFETGRYRKTATVDALPMSEAFTVETLEGIVEAKAGDYLARGIKGEYYIIPRDFFETHFTTV